MCMEKDAAVCHGYHSLHFSPILSVAIFVGKNGIGVLYVLTVGSYILSDTVLVVLAIWREEI